jgi:serine protease Do
MRTKHTLILICFIISAFSVFAQQNDEQKVVITKKVRETDGSYTSETIIKKGQAARDFNIDEYVKNNKASNVDLEIRSEGGDEERSIVLRGSEGPRKTRGEDIEEEVENIIRDVDVEVRRGVNWVSKSIENSRNYNYSSDNYYGTNDAFLGVEEDSDEDEDKDGLVIEVVKNSAAEKAGLRDNDIMMSLNDTKINRWSDLTKFIRNAKKDDKVKINYKRNGKEMTTEAVLTNRNDVNKITNKQARTPKGFLGVCPFGDVEDEPGLRVSITKKSGAEKSGLKNGDIILQLNDTEINDFEDVQDFMEYIKPGDKIKVKYKRDGKVETTEATVGEQESWDWGQADWNDEDIEIRSKSACLGVCNESVTTGNRRGANVVNVVCNSAAKLAGLQAGDLIVEINGNRIQDSDDLWAELAKFNPNSQVAIAYVRDGNDHIAEATLNTCDDNYEQITMTENDELGNSSERQFFAWNMDESDETELRERQIITIRGAADNDAPVINPLEGNESDPMNKERSLEIVQFRTFQNPTHGHITLEFEVDPVPTVVNLYDLQGRQLFQEELNAFDGMYKQQFDLSALLNNLILVRIQQGDKVFMEEILVQD